MASERQNMSEQEISIKAREHELYVQPLPGTDARHVKPFDVYLREHPRIHFRQRPRASSPSSASSWDCFFWRPVAGDHAPPTSGTDQEGPTGSEVGPRSTTVLVADSRVTGRHKVVLVFRRHAPRTCKCAQHMRRSRRQTARPESKAIDPRRAPVRCTVSRSPRIAKAPRTGRFRMPTAKT